MAITFTEERKKQKKLIWILLLIVGAIVLVLIFGFSQREKLLVSIKESLGTPAIILEELGTNFEILKSPFLRELRPFEEIEPFGEEIGRENPFLPY